MFKCLFFLLFLPEFLDCCKSCRERGLNVVMRLQCSLEGLIVDVEHRPWRFSFAVVAHELAQYVSLFIVSIDDYDSPSIRLWVCWRIRGKIDERNGGCVVSSRFEVFWWQVNNPKLEWLTWDREKSFHRRLAELGEFWSLQIGSVNFAAF